MFKTLTCTSCGVEFGYEHLTGPTRKTCDACRVARKRQTDSAKSKRYRERDPERTREQQNRSNRKRLADPEHLRWKREDAMRRAYGLEPADYDRLLSHQNGRCAICGGGHVGPGRRLHVDHCHATNKVRGLLCARCNTAIGLLGDDAERAQRLATYLRT